MQSIADHTAVQRGTCELVRLLSCEEETSWFSGRVIFTTGNREKLTSLHHALLVFSFKVERDKLSERQFVQGLGYLGSPSGHCPPCTQHNQTQDYPWLPFVYEAVCE